MPTNGRPHPFTDGRWLDLSEALLERLRGRVSLVQPDAERRQFASAALHGACKDLGEDQFPELADGEQRDAFLNAFLSYDLIEDFLTDPTVEDIMINSTDPIFLHRTGEGLVKTDRRFASSRELALFVNKLVVFGGRAEIDPINDIELYNIRGRINIAHSPFGPQITITRGKPNPLTILQLIENRMLTYELAAQLWTYVEGLRVRPANLLIAGGPGTGKTTLLNALLSFIPWQDRMVVIEDTLELNTQCLENCSRLESCRRTTLPQLVKNSLRMRPDRILVGEVRGVEANDMMTAMSLGKYCMSTVHASTARETVLRLQNEPMNVPPVLVSLIDIVVILRKLRTDGTPTRMVCELVETGGMEQQVVLLSQVWRYDAEQQRVIESMPSSTYRDRLSAESGLRTVVIMDETARRAKILRRMHESGRFPDIESVTRFCQRYSDHPEEALADLGFKKPDPKKR